MSAALELHDVTVRYRDVVALANADLTVEAGQVCGLIGLNGSGKSTLLKAVTGAVRLDGGRVEVDGGPPAVARRRGVLSYVPQSEAIDWDFPLSVREVVMTGRYGRLGLTRRPRQRDRDAVAEALDRVDLTTLADRQVGRLSGGQRKRVFVARGLAQGARVLLLDEPFAGVDKRSEATITGLLRDHAAAGGTVLVATHDLHALPALADTAVLLRNRILRHGPAREVLEPGHLVEAFGLDPLGRAAG